ncbi:hypothetical protein HDU97_002203 [Phlyctochytrium planicorne]|nr:hypothetical protein HDU97_002203 [Phlyctochytrium planicorne]
MPNNKGRNHTYPSSQHPISSTQSLHEKIRLLRDRFSYRPPLNARYLPTNTLGARLPASIVDPNVTDASLIKQENSAAAPDIDVLTSERRGGNE